MYLIWGKKIWIRLKCLLVSMISQTMPTQTSALCLFSDCHVLFVSPWNVSTHKHTHRLEQFFGNEVKWREVGWRGDGWCGSSAWSLDVRQSAECMWKPNPLCPSSPNKLCAIVWVLHSAPVSSFPVSSDHVTSDFCEYSDSFKLLKFLTH